MDYLFTMAKRSKLTEKVYHKFNSIFIYNIQRFFHLYISRKIDFNGFTKTGETKSIPNGTLTNALPTNVATDSRA